MSVITRAVLRTGVLMVAAGCGLSAFGMQEAVDDWWPETLAELSERYLNEPLSEGAPCDLMHTRLDRVAAAIGQGLADSEVDVSPEDVATLALLLSSRPDCSRLTQPDPNDLSSEQEVSIATPSPQIVDLGRGEEGLIQGIERLAALPVTERLVLTGDIVSGLQMATVADSPHLGSAFGRARVNFIVRTVPDSPDGSRSAGYFFLQIRAAGGAFDSSSVGGPVSFSAFNDVATDRSRFNEGTSRGNLYLSKAYLQQDLRLWGGRLTGRIGIVNQADFFDTNQFANNENRQFINSGLVNSAAYKTGISAPGFTLEYNRPWEWKVVTGITYRAGYSMSRTDRAFASPLWNGEVEAETLFYDQLGRWRFGASVGNVAGVGGVHSFFFSGNQQLSSEYGLFLRYATNNEGPGSLAFGPLKQSYSLGFQRRLAGGTSPSALGVGFSQAFPIVSQEPQASERIIETYYRWQWLENFSLAPDFQLIFGSGGRTEKGTHVVFGLSVVLGLEGGM